MIEENKLCFFYNYECLRLKACEKYFIGQYQLLNELVEIIRKNGRPERLFELSLLLPSLVSNSEAIINLINSNSLPEAYIISRAFFEKCVNFCYLIVCDEKEYGNYIDWFYQKNMRSVYTSQKAFKSVGHEIELPDILEMTEKFEVLKKFTGKKGGEKPNWTDVSLYQRIKYIESKVASFPAPIYSLTMNVIYENASENLHGTLYGATFHTGSLRGASKTVEEQQIHVTGLSGNLYFFLGNLIGGMFGVVTTRISIDEIINKLKGNLKNFEDMIPKKLEPSFFES